MKILLAEDEQQLSRVLETAMTHEGYQVDTAFDGQEAVDLAKINAYDLMILDIMMPVKTGIEALKEIRQTGNTTHVIMLTAMSEVDDKVTGLDAGADDYLTKPFSLKELLTAGEPEALLSERASGSPAVYVKTGSDVHPQFAADWPNQSQCRRT